MTSPTCDGINEVPFPVDVSASNNSTFCLRNVGPRDVCNGNNVNGMCPDVQAGLPYGSYCAPIGNNVFGCLSRATCIQDDTIANPTVACAAVDATVPTPDKCQTLTNGTWLAISVIGRASFCANVRGTQGVCVGANARGSCPLAQAGLKEGSVCALQSTTGVYGCVPRTDCTMLTS
ncbi:Aste57867_22312 [Aphanomyces stellatus]|uniref:Aste57867_22312 protein n=1 Tax=Aphanomyces stellatus TaxID=120398 RepID=A0A485LJR7_9STRA|nr:hypothetical protein As57867_022242 [Aphanomyces stellatus]VFT98976.1 Aste57867_22312 [Aphanomyces stellatus]